MKKRKNLFANQIHKDIFYLVAIGTIVPTIVVTVALYYLIFGVIAEQLAMPEMINYNVIPAARKVTLILSFAMPLVIVTILVFAHKITHNIVGPFDRIVREVAQVVEGSKRTPIKIRPRDKFRPLVDKINKLIDMV